MGWRERKIPYLITGSGTRKAISLNVWAVIDLRLFFCMCPCVCTQRGWEVGLGGLKIGSGNVNTNVAPGPPDQRLKTPQLVVLRGGAVNLLCVLPD